MTPKQLTATMKKHGLNSYNVAELTGVDYSTITRYLTGKRKIPKIFSICLNLALANGK